MTHYSFPDVYENILLYMVVAKPHAQRFPLHSSRSFTSRYLFIYLYKFNSRNTNSRCVLQSMIPTMQNPTMTANGFGSYMAAAMQPISQMQPASTQQPQAQPHQPPSTSSAAQQQVQHQQPAMSPHQNAPQGQSQGLPSAPPLPWSYYSPFAGYQPMAPMAQPVCGNQSQAAATNSSSTTSTAQPTGHVTPDDIINHSSITSTAAVAAPPNVIPSFYGNYYSMPPMSLGPMAPIATPVTSTGAVPQSDDQNYSHTSNESDGED